MKLKSLLWVTVLTSVLAGCSPGHRVVLKSYAGLDEATAESVRRGYFTQAPDQVFEAVATSLERDPFKMWKFEKLDKANGLITVTALLYHRADIRVSAAEKSGSKVTVSYNESTGGNAADIYVPLTGTAVPTAYLPENPENYSKIPALFKLDNDYFLSHIYRILNKMGPVPFELVDKE